MNRISEINDNSLHIIEELCGLYQFPSVDKVLAVLLQRYGVMEFYQLQCGEIASVPSLSLLVQIVNKVQNCI